MITTVRRGSRRLLLVFVLALLATGAAAALVASPAAAAPPGPTMSLDQLRTALAASPGGLPGYFKTVLQSDDTSDDNIVDVSATILAVVDGANGMDGSPLIMFQVTDPAVLAAGGVAEGMSGSPLYLSTGDVLVGGVSYGDWFTTQGLGLATPIELMASIETDYQVGSAGSAALAAQQGPLGGPTALPLRTLPRPDMPKVRTGALDHPVTAAGHTYRRLAIARSPKAARALAPTAGTAVMVPLSALEVGGLPANSRAFKKLQTAMEKRGVDVVPAPAGQGSADFAPDLAPGASVAAVLASGDFWAFYVGTVTYVDDDTVVAFGHSTDDYFGTTALTLANARVYGIWSSLIDPYKMASLGAARGTFTQDRKYGIAGSTAIETPTIEVDASATVPGNGAPHTVDSVTRVPRFIAQSLDYGSWFVADACYTSIWLATDSYNYPGYAATHLSANVSDQADTQYTITRDNVYDDTYDVGFYAVYDIEDIFGTLLYDQYGTAPATIDSVAFQAQLTPTHAATSIVDFRIPGGLVTGANPVHVILRDYGQTTTHQVDTTITVPKGLDPSGEVDVYGSPSSFDWEDYYALDGSSTTLSSNTDPPPTVADVVADINGWSTNDQVLADFYSDESGPMDDGLVSATPLTLTDGDTQLYVDGYVYKESASMRMMPNRPRCALGATVRLRGYVGAWDAVGTKVALYRGSSSHPFVRVPIRYDKESGAIVFSATVKNIRQTTRLRAVWGGSDQYIGARCSCKVRVLAK